MNKKRKKKRLNIFKRLIGGGINEYTHTRHLYNIIKIISLNAILIDTRTGFVRRILFYGIRFIKKVFIRKKNH